MIFVAVYELLHCLLCLKDATLVSFKTDFNSTSQMQKSVRYAMGGMRCVVRSRQCKNVLHFAMDERGDAKMRHSLLVASWGHTDCPPRGIAW
jgi:hypothetical protein